MILTTGMLQGPVVKDGMGLLGASLDGSKLKDVDGLGWESFAERFNCDLCVHTERVLSDGAATAACLYR